MKLGSIGDFAFYLRAAKSQINEIANWSSASACTQSIVPFVFIALIKQTTEWFENKSSQISAKLAPNILTTLLESQSRLLKPSCHIRYLKSYITTESPCVLSTYFVDFVSTFLRLRLSRGSKMLGILQKKVNILLLNSNNKPNRAYDICHEPNSAMLFLFINFHKSSSNHTGNASVSTATLSKHGN